MASTSEMRRDDSPALESGPFAFVSDCVYQYVTSINVLWLFVAALVVSLCFSMRIPGPEEPQQLNLFHTTTLKVVRTPYDLQWNHANRPLTNWRFGTIRQDLIGKSAWIDRLDAINQGVNRSVRYSEDQSLYGKLDYWAAPDETVQRMAGDCEDAAILKMAILASSGFPRDKMFLTIGRDLVSRNAHAVLRG